MTNASLSAPEVFGVYFINTKDENWTLVESRPTIEKARSLMSGFGTLMAERFKSPPYCMAISRGHTEEFIPRAELSSVTGFHG